MNQLAVAARIGDDFEAGCLKCAGCARLPVTKPELNKKHA
jgi:hypothetical protein